MQLTFNAGNLPTQRQVGASSIAPGGVFGEAFVSELNPQYHALVKTGKVFTLASANIATLTAFVGAAAGTPLFGIYNPPNSGVDLTLLQTRLAIRTTGTTAALDGFNYWLGTQGSTPITGTQTVARNMYSGAQAGSNAYCMVNVANTAAVASALIAPSFSLGNVTTTAGVNVTSLVDDLKGLIVVAPGNYLAFGAYTALAVAAIDGGLMWAETPA